MIASELEKKLNSSKNWNALPNLNRLKLKILNLVILATYNAFETVSNIFLQFWNIFK